MSAKASVAADPATLQASMSPAEADRISILIVDDEPKNLTVLETVLDDPCYRLVNAGSAEQALLALITDEFALLILDINMPGMNGFELAQMIKDRKKTAHVPIIFLTAYYNEEQHVLEGYGTGAVDYLHKPVNPVVLRSKVAVFAELYRKNRELGLANRALATEVAKRRHAEDELRLLNQTLEDRVRERTSELQENQLRLRHAADAARLTYVAVDNVLGEAVAAGNFGEVMGFALPPGTESERLLIEHVLPSDRARVQTALSDLSAGKPVDSFEYRVVGDDRTERWIESEWFVELDSEGKPRKTFVTNLDISAQKLVQEKLRDSEDGLRQMADSMPQMVWTARADGAFDYYNQRWHEFAGAGHRLYPDLASWEPIIHTQDVSNCRSAWAGSLGSGEPYRVEYRLWDRRVNRYTWHLGRALAVKDQSGNILKWIGTCTDIDEQKRTEEDLRRANHALEQFAFAVSHDLQEPIRNIAVFTELLHQNCGPDLSEETARFLKIILNGAQYLSRLVSDLLVYMHLACPDEETATTVESEKVLDQVLINLGAAVQEAHASITHDTLPLVSVQSIHLEQVLQNLIGNALKYRRDDQPPTVHISASREDSQWRFAIRDNGIGIAPEYRTHVFRIFQRLHPKGGKYPGTGIGLAVCQKIIERYGGRIWVESEPGTGSTFNFTVPGQPGIQPGTLT